MQVLNDGWSSVSQQVMRHRAKHVSGLQQHHMETSFPLFADWIRCQILLVWSQSSLCFALHWLHCSPLKTAGRSDMILDIFQHKLQWNHYDDKSPVRSFRKCRNKNWCRLWGHHSLNYYHYSLNAISRHLFASFTVDVCLTSLMGSLFADVPGVVVGGTRIFVIDNVFVQQSYSCVLAIYVQNRGNLLKLHIHFGKAHKGNWHLKHIVTIYWRNQVVLLNFLHSIKCHNLSFLFKENQVY